jgi:hypothetical protein
MFCLSLEEKPLLDQVVIKAVSKAKCLYIFKFGM